MYVSSLYSRLYVRLTTSGMVLLKFIFHQMVTAIALIGISLDLFIFYSRWCGVRDSWGREIVEQNTTEEP